MAQVKVFYEPETELLTVFWQQPTGCPLTSEIIWALRMGFMVDSCQGEKCKDL